MARLNLIFRPPLIPYEDNLVSPTIADIGLNPTDSPVLYTFASEELVGSKLVLTITTGGAVAEGDTFTLKGVTFTAYDYPTGTGEFFTTDGATAAQQVDWADSLTRAINETAALNEDYAAFWYESGGTYYVQLRATSPGAALDLNVGTDISDSANFVYNKITAGADANRADKFAALGYRAYLEVWALDYAFWNTYGPAQDATPRLLGRLEQPYTGVNVFQFDVAPYLRAELEGPTLDPTELDAELRRQPNTVLRYFLRYGESVIGQLNEEGGYSTSTPERGEQRNYFFVGETEPEYATIGAFEGNIFPALNLPYWRGYNIAETNPGQYVTKLLTEAPAAMLRRRTQDPYFLAAFIAFPGDAFPGQRFGWRYYVQYMDGTTSAETDLLQTDPDPGGYYLSNVALNLGTGSANAIPLGTLETADRVRSLFVRLAYNDSPGPLSVPLTDWQEYRIDTQAYSQHYRTLYWRSRIGGVEQFTFEGAPVEAVTRNPVEFEKRVAPDYTTSPIAGDRRNQAPRATHLVRTETTHTLTSGWLTRAEMDYLKGMLSAPEVFIYEREDFSDYNSRLTGQATTLPTISANSFVPVVITAQTWQVDTAEPLYQLQITYIKSQPEPIAQL